MLIDFCHKQSNKNWTNLPTFLIYFFAVINMLPAVINDFNTYRTCTTMGRANECCVVYYIKENWQEMENLFSKQICAFAAWKSLFTLYLFSLGMYSSSFCTATSITHLTYERFRACAEKSIYIVIETLNFAIIVVGHK